MKWKARHLPQNNQNETYELKHYGILGMKWGVRRTPEQLGHRVKKNTAREGQKLKYTSPFAQQLKNTAKATALSYIPGANTYRLISYNMKYEDHTNYLANNETLSSLKKKAEGSNDSVEKDAKSCNKSGKKGYVKNCFNCVCAFEMRQRGYDVEATPRSVGAFDKEYKEMFSGVKIQNSSLPRKEKESRKKWVERNYEYLCKNLEENPEGSRGFLSFSYEGTTSGHTMVWTVKDGQAMFIDPQSGKTNATALLSLSGQDYVWGRLDNTKPSDKIGTIVKSKGDKKK